MDGWTDERTKILPILQDFVPYRGRCPKRQPVAQRHQMASDSLALLLFISLDLPLGSSGPNRGQSPVEWGETLYVHTYVCPPIHLADWN